MTRSSMEEYVRSLSAIKISQEKMFATIRELLGDALDRSVERSQSLKITLYEAAVSIGRIAFSRLPDGQKEAVLGLNFKRLIES